MDILHPESNVVVVSAKKKGTTLSVPRYLVATTFCAPKSVLLKEVL